jgi:D-aspartate ligase
VATPRTHTVRDRSDIGEELDSFVYPCGLKPVHGHLFVQRSGIAVKVMVIHSRAELERVLERMLELGLAMQVTEIVQGGDDQIVAYFTYMDEHGNPLMNFTNRKLRQLPIHFGVGTYVIGEELPDVADEGLRFLRAAGLRGIAHVEFKRDRRDGQLRLIECNHRFNLAIGLLRASGLDLPLFTYNRLIGQGGPSLSNPRYGLRLWHPVADFRAFLGYRAASELTTRQWLRSVLHRQRFSRLDLRDPLPSVVDHLRGIGELRRRRTLRPPP